MKNEKAFQLAKEWTENKYFEQKDRDVVALMLKDPDKFENEINESFHKNLEFGTGGLRAIIGMGSNRINKYNVRRATQAMANAVLDEKTKNPKACISFDNRHFSKEFALEAACVFAANGIKTYVYDSLTPTPMLSYAVRYYKANCGIMVTASHNPKAYNGFKAYWSDGAQVTPPFDDNIIKNYELITSWDEIKMIDFNQAIETGQIEWIEDGCKESYYQLIEEKILQPQMCKDHGDKVHFIFTPLHGCGYPFCDEISKRMGFTKFEVVQSQAVPDGDFTTVESTPNPEDPVALKLAVALMQESNADIAYGTDPDGDRLGVVVNVSGVPNYLNGNQIAIIMLSYIFEQRSQQNSMPKNPLVIKSIVTSPLQKTIARAFGADTIDTLTGFKWMARLWKDLEDQETDYNFLFASEESFGYLPYNFVRDKDAVSSIALMNEIVLHYKLKHMNLVEALDEIYKKHGFAQESLIALNFEGIQGSEKIKNIMKYFRENPELMLAGLKTKNFTDYERSSEQNLISNVLRFEFNNGDILFVRPSGTEPKIKFYTMVQVTGNDLAGQKLEASERIKKIESEIHSIVETL